MKYAVVLMTLLVVLIASCSSRTAVDEILADAVEEPLQELNEIEELTNLLDEEITFNELEEIDFS